MRFGQKKKEILMERLRRTCIALEGVRRDVVGFLSEFMLWHAASASALCAVRLCARMLVHNGYYKYARIIIPIDLLPGAGHPFFLLASKRARAPQEKQSQQTTNSHQGRV